MGRRAHARPTELDMLGRLNAAFAFCADTKPLALMQNRFLFA